jgi:phage baseplate assembly protein W
MNGAGMMSQVAFPYRIDERGRTAQADDARHVRDLIEQVLFTSPGERVNRPAFGSGILQLVFAPTSDALAATVQASVLAALQRWLGELIQVADVRATSVDALLTVEIDYVILISGERRTDTFTRQA